MINEANSDLSHAELVSYTATHLRRKSWEVWTEFKLPHGRVADVIGRDPHGTIVIFEAKTLVRQWERHTAVARYYEWCNKLYLVTNRADPPISVKTSLSLPDARAQRELGLAHCDRLDLNELREPRLHPLDDSRWRRLNQEFTQRPAATPWLRGRLTPCANCG